MEGWSLKWVAATLPLLEWRAACGSAGPVQPLLLLDSSCALGMWKLKFLDQGSNPHPLQQKGGVLTTELPGNSPQF